MKTKGASIRTRTRSRKRNAKPASSQPNPLQSLTDLATKEFQKAGLIVTEATASLSMNAQPKSDDVPLLVERVQIETEQTGKTYEEANWAKLSPLFRRAHNRLRVTKGLAPIPPPKADLWVPPKKRKGQEYDFSSREFQANAREFLGVGGIMGGGGQGFENRGKGSADWGE